MTVDELVQNLTASRVEFEAFLAEIPADLMEVPGAAGDWSVKDILGHIGMYEAWTADWIRERAWPKVPSEYDFMETDQRNDAYFEFTRHRPLDEVLAEEIAAYRSLLAQ